MNYGPTRRPWAVLNLSQSVGRESWPVRRLNRAGVGNHTRNELRAVVRVFVHPRAWAIFSGVWAVNRGPWAVNRGPWVFFLIGGPRLSGRKSRAKRTRNEIQATRDVALEPDVNTMFFTNICQKFHIMFYLQKNL